MNQVVLKEEAKERVFTELTPYFEGDFLGEIGRVDLVKTKLNNLDEALLGGLTKGVYLFTGRFHESLSALMIQFVEELASQKMAVIYLTKNEKRAQLIQQLIVRYYYKQMRDKTPSISSIMHELNTNPLARKKILETLRTITNHIAVIERNIGFDDLEQRLLKLKNKNCELVIFVDDYYYKRDVGWALLKTLAKELSIPILVSRFVSMKDFEELQAGFPPSQLLSASDNLIFLNQIPQTKEKNLQDSTTLFNLSIYSHVLPFTTKQTYLTYHNNYFYFQDA